MIKKLSVREFKEYCDCNKLGEVAFSTGNQNWCRVSDPCRIQMSFKIILISDNPSMVCLKSDTGTVCFDRVRYVEINTESTVLGTIIWLYCGGTGFMNPEVTYTLVAS